MKNIVRLLWVGLLFTGLAIAQNSIPQVKVQFAKGTSSKTIKGTLKGDQTIDYVVRAAAAQTMTVTLQTKNTATYFNVIPPGEENAAIFIGSTSGNKYEGALPSTGDYKIRVYMMRSAARRGEAASYSLTISVAGKAQSSSKGSSTPTVGADQDKQGFVVGRAGEGKYNATGKIPCAQHKGQPMAQCNFGVARASGGTAAVAIIMPDGRKRMIFFSDGKATGSDWSHSDGGSGTFQATKDSDLYTISVGQERYEIPEAVVFGG